MRRWGYGTEQTVSNRSRGMRPREAALTVFYVFAYCSAVIAAGAVVMFLVFTVAS